jgi:hypothetical protein
MFPFMAANRVDGCAYPVSLPPATGKWLINGLIRAETVGEISSFSATDFTANLYADIGRAPRVTGY